MQSAFRPEVQALRALAVAAVLVYHLWPAKLSGGFVGVDVFFVISGFLISAQLWAELQRRGTVSLVNFYSRRIRRLLPAAALVLVVCAIATVVWLPLSLHAQAATEIAASGLYVENWLLAGAAVDYSNAGAAHSLVQHYWSLSVEEQFYLVWPGLILLASVLALRIRRASPRVALVAAFAVVFACSLAFSIGETARSPASAYFVTPTRAWEFAAGALIAVAPSLAPAPDAPSRAHRWARTVAGWLGLALIIAAAAAFDNETPFPGVAAIVPVLGAVLVIVGGSPQSRLSSGPLGRLRAVQFFGGISYSVYLWHWPLIVLLPFATGLRITLVTGLVLCVLTIVLATATKHLVEDPARASRWLSLPRRRTFVFAALAMVSVVAVSLPQLAALASQRQQFDVRVASFISSHGECVGAGAMDPAHDCGNRYDVTDTAVPAFARDDGAATQECMQTQTREALVTCEWGDTTRATEVVAVVGDSHAVQLAWTLDEWAKENATTIRTYAKSSCPAIAVERRNASASCTEWTSAVVDKLASDPTVSIVLYTNSTALYTLDRFGAESDLVNPLRPSDIEQTLIALRDAGKIVVAVRDVPGTRGVGLECLELADTSDPCPTPRSSALTDDAIVVAARESAVPLVDLSDSFCDSVYCHSVIGGLVVYSDQAGHLTKRFAATLGPAMSSALADALAG